MHSSIATMPSAPVPGRALRLVPLSESPPCETAPSITALGREFDTALMNYKAAGEALEKVEKKFELQVPPFPAAMRVRSRDVTLFRQILDLNVPELKRVGQVYYGKGEIAAMQRGPMLTQCERRPRTKAEKERYGFHKKDVIITFVPCPAAQRRANKILAAYYLHAAEVEHLRIRLGMLDVERIYHVAGDHLFAVIGRIVATPAATFAGIKVKAKIMAYLARQRGGDMGLDARLLRSLIDDIASAPEPDVPTVKLSIAKPAAA